VCGPVQAIARVRLAPRLSREVFEAHLRTIPAVRSASYVIGDVDYELRLACRDLADLAGVLASLRGCPRKVTVRPR
jgi:Lrp/AsnC family transcriptional regulator, leucine-responsive regulatory protein